MRFISLYVSLLRYGVVATASPRMATRQAFERKPATLQRTILAKRLNSILRAGGHIAARGRCEGRDAVLVKPHQ